MNITYGMMGELLQVFGVLLILLSQVWFGYRAWRKYGRLEKAFFVLLSIHRMIGDDLVTKGEFDVKKLRKLPEEELKKTYPEYWILAKYLSDDIRYSAIGLLVTLIGLAIAMFEGYIQLPLV